MSEPNLSQAEHVSQGGEPTVDRGRLQLPLAKIGKIKAGSSLGYKGWAIAIRALYTRIMFSSISSKKASALVLARMSSGVLHANMPNRM